MRHPNTENVLALIRTTESKDYGTTPPTMMQFEWLQSKYTKYGKYEKMVKDYGSQGLRMVYAMMIADLSPIPNSAGVIIMSGEKFITYGYADLNIGFPPSEFTYEPKEAVVHPYVINGFDNAMSSCLKNGQKHILSVYYAGIPSMSILNFCMLAKIKMFYLREKQWWHDSFAERMEIKSLNQEFIVKTS